MLGCIAATEGTIYIFRPASFAIQLGHVRCKPVGREDSRYPPLFYAMRPLLPLSRNNSSSTGRREFPSYFPALAQPPRDFIFGSKANILFYISGSR